MAHVFRARGSRASELGFHVFRVVGFGFLAHLPTKTRLGFRVVGVLRPPIKGYLTPNSGQSGLLLSN